MAADSAAIKSTFFHPEHLLSRYHYSEASTHSCAACELTVTGAGYSCDECAFNIHEACLSLPLLEDLDGHPGHELTLTPLPIRQPLVRRLQGDLRRRALYVPLRGVQLRRAPLLTSRVRYGGEGVQPAELSSRSASLASGSSGSWIY